MEHHNQTLSRNLSFHNSVFAENTARAFNSAQSRSSSNPSQTTNAHQHDMSFNRNPSCSTLFNSYIPHTNEGLAVSSANLDSGISVTGGSGIRLSATSARWRPGIRKCSNCDEDFEFGNPKTFGTPEMSCFWCLECDGYIIDSCIIAHLINKVTKFHTFTDSSNCAVRPKLCQMHRDFVVSFCVDCSCDCCSQCVAGMSHRGHLLRPIEEHKSQLVRVAEGVNNVRLERERQLQIRADELDSFKNSCLEFQEDAKEKVMERFDQLRNCLDEQERQLLSDLENMTSSFDRIEMQIRECQNSSQKLRLQVDRIHHSPKSVTAHELIAHNSQLVSSETEVLSAFEYELPKLSLMTTWTNPDASEDLKSFQDSIRSASYKLFPPSIKPEFQLDIQTIIEEPEESLGAEVVQPNQVAQTEHFRKSNLASLVVRDIAYDEEHQRLFVAFKNGKSILQYSLLGHHQANIEVHSVPWRLDFKNNVLYFSVQSLEGVFGLTVAGENPQVEKVCHLKTCAFALTNFQSSTTTASPLANQSTNQTAPGVVIVIARVSKPELCVYDCSTAQIVNRTAHGLQQVHYVAHEPNSGMVAISNANDAVVLIFSPQLYLFIKLDSQTHRLKWPIGLSFNSSNASTLKCPTDQETEMSIYICDSDNHQIVSYNISTNQIVRKYENLQGAAFAKLVTPKLLLSASVLNLKIKFIKTEN